MGVRTVLTMVMALLLAMVSSESPVARAGDDTAKPWERVEYRSTPGRKAIVSLILTSATEAEVVPFPGMKAVRGTWSLVASPEVAIRFVAPDRTVRGHSFDGETLIDRGDVTLRPVTGLAWHKATAARSDIKPSQGFVSADGDAWFLHPDGTADWGSGRPMVMLAVDAARKPDGTLVLTLPDGSTRLLRPRGTGWEDFASNQEFQPIPSRVEEQRRVTCTNHLSQLAGLFLVQSIERPGRPKYDGVAIVLSWRWSGRIKSGEEEVLRCPGDPDVRPLDEAGRKAYDGVDDPKNPPLDLCSYAFRDFTKYPLKNDAPTLQIIACDRQGKDGSTPHHADGICVAFDNGSARFMTREDLGLKPDEPIVVGPDSKVELLRVMCQVPKR